MANTNNHVQTVVWAAATPVALNTTARVASDALTISPDAFMASVQVTATNQGSPAVGDTVAVWAQWSVDGTNFGTMNHGEYLGMLDTNSVDPGENPASRNFVLLVAGKQKFKLVAKAHQGSTRVINLSAAYNELQSS